MFFSKVSWNSSSPNYDDVHIYKKLKYLPQGPLHFRNWILPIWFSIFDNNWSCKNGNIIKHIVGKKLGVMCICTAGVLKGFTSANLLKQIQKRWGHSSESPLFYVQATWRSASLAEWSACERQYVLSSWLPPILEIGFLNMFKPLFHLKPACLPDEQLQ